MSTKETSYWDSWNVGKDGWAADITEMYSDLGTQVLSEVAALQLVSPRIIEIGCGTGWLARRIEGDGGYLGLDLSPEAIERAKRSLPNRRFLALDFHDWEPAEDPFHVALIIDTVAYFRDQDLALTKVAKLLRPGGYVVLSTVNPIVYSRLSWVGPPAEGQVRKWLSKSRLEALVQRAGLTVLKSYTVFPAGDRGFLRFLNTPKLTRPLDYTFLGPWYRRVRERCGLGRFRIVVAQRTS